MVSGCGGIAAKDRYGNAAGSAGLSLGDGGSASAPAGVAGGANSTGGGGSSGATTDPCSGPLSIADPDAEQLLREQIGKPTQPLYAADFADVSTLDWVPHGTGPCPAAPNCPTPEPPQSDGWVTSLVGLECLPHLQSIVIDAWYVADFSQLSALRELKTLDIFFSKRAKFAPLPQLRELKVLNSDGDLAALPALPNLTSLSAHFEDLSGENALAPLRSMVSVRNLALSNCAIRDVSGLETLTGLVTLDLSRNSISDLSPLLQNRALGTGTTIDIHDNPIPCDDPSVAALAKRKVRVECDP